MFFDTPTGENPFLFSALDAPLYAALLARLCSSKHEPAYNFLKLVLEGARLMKKGNKKGHEMAARIEKNI